MMYTATPALSSMSAMSGSGPVANAIEFPQLNTSNLLIRFATNNTDLITLANATNAVTTWAPEQVGSIPTFNFTRSNTTDSESPQFVANDPTFSKPAITIGFNNRAMNFDGPVNAAFANTGLTWFAVISIIDNTPRTGTFIRYREEGGSFTKNEITQRNISGQNRFRWVTFNPAGDVSHPADTADNTRFIMTYTHQSGNRAILRRNGVEIINTFASHHWQTVGSGSGRRISIGGAGIGTITEECTPTNILDLAFYQNTNTTFIESIENTLATFYGITLP